MVNGPSLRRRRDSAASRERLLQAATELFNDRGFDRTTARDGRHAGTFEHLSKAGTDEVLPLLRDMLDRR